MSKGTSPLEGQQVVLRKYYLAMLVFLERGPRKTGIGKVSRMRPPFRSLSMRVAGVFGPTTSSGLSAAEVPL